MKTYGYDAESNALFSWDSDFRFEGIRTSAPEGAFISSDRQLDEMTGCAFMSGWSEPLVVIRSDGIDERFELFAFDVRTRRIWQGKGAPKEHLIKMAAWMPICVCGKIVSFPDKMADLCRRFPNSKVYACPVVDELAAFGVLVRNLSLNPRRIPMAWENRESIDAESISYDPVLEGDAMGRMADVVARGMPAVNEMMTTVGVSPFYGRTLFRDETSGIAMVRISEMDYLFSTVPVSAKNYAATSVPVRMRNTDQFAERTGYNGTFVDVFVATDYMLGVCDFLRFLAVTTKKGIAFSADQIRVKHADMVSVFRWDRAYRVPREKYEQSRGFLCGEQGAAGRPNLD
jgi:hypothetical protein